MTRTCLRVLVGFSAAAAAALTPAPASGVAPMRQCPENFPVVITRAEALEIDDAVIFDAVNKNGDDIVCFKPFANKDGGVVKDNTAVGPTS
jgi:hypothetical protein